MGLQTWGKQQNSHYAQKEKHLQNKKAIIGAQTGKKLTVTDTAREGQGRCFQSPVFTSVLPKS